MNSRADFDPMAELEGVLGEGDAVRPPDRLGARVLADALQARTPGRPLDSAAPAEPRDAFDRAIESLDELLASLCRDDWDRPAIRNLSVQGLVGHLVGVERAFAAVLADPECAHARADHVESTDRVALAQAGRAPAATMADWRSAVTDTRRALDAPTASADSPLGLHGVRLPLGSLLTVRTFELWTHEEDIRRATDRALSAPDDGTLRLMTDLAVALVSATLGRGNPERPAQRLVLTGAAGGTWRIPSPEAGALRGPPTGAVVVMETVGFCRLVANRLDPSAGVVSVSGDPEVANELFAAAASLALD